MAERREDLKEQIERDGFAMLGGVFQAPEVERFGSFLGKAFESRFTRTRQGNAFAIRNLLVASPELKTVAASEPLVGFAASVVGDGARPVMGLLFDKVPEANWQVPWHQDLTIAVDRRVDVAGWGPWSMKLGIPHVEPPVEVLRGLVTLRVHLDPCDDQSGALKVIPGSHLLGRIADADTREAAATRPAEVCVAAAGDVLVMSPLLLHSSAPSTEPRHRRVLHFVYAAIELPDGLAWYDDKVSFF